MRSNKNNMRNMKPVKLLFVIALLLLVPYIVSADITTGVLSPSSIDACGPYSNSFDLISTNIWNTDAFTHYDVEARLVNPDANAFDITSSEIIYMGDIANMSESDMAQLSWSVSCNEGNAGDYNFYIEFSNATGFVSNTIGSAESDVTLHAEVMNPLTLTVDEPSEEYYTSSPDLEVTTSRDSECRYSAQDVDYEEMNYFLTGAATAHSVNFGPINEGEQTYYIKCKTADDVYDAGEVTFVYDVTVPEVSSYSPVGVVSSNQVTFTATSNEDADCKYSTTSETLYADMSALQSSNDRDHSLNLLNLDDGTYKYYIKCQDFAGNTNEEGYEATLTVDNAPSASIDVDESEPLSRGEYDVTLTSSEDLAYAPILKLNVGGSTYDIFLEGVGDVWEGRLSLTDESIDNVIGQFVFTGVDLTGNSGSKIEGGSTIKIDTLAPARVDGVSVIYTDRRVKISWKDIGEDVDHYIVYRSDSAVVDFDNELDDTTGSVMYDSSVESGSSYYYFIAAVDEAGNIGDVSSQSKVTIPRLETTITKPSGKVVPIVDNIADVTVARIETDIKEVEDLIAQYESSRADVIDTLTKEEIDDILGISADYDKQIKALNEVKSRISNVDRSNDRDTRKVLDKLELQIKETKKVAVQEIVMVEDKTYDLKYEESFSNRVIDNLYSLARIGEVSQKDRSADIRDIDKINSEEKVAQNAQVFYVKQYDGTLDYYTLVTLKAEDEEAKVVAEIDGRIVDDFNKITSNDIQGKIATYDLILFKSNAVSYIVNEKLKLESLANIKAALIPDSVVKLVVQVPDTEMPIETTKGVSKLWSFLKKHLISSIGLLSIMVLLVYYFLIMDDEQRPKTPRVHTPKEGASKHSIANSDYLENYEEHQVPPRREIISESSIVSINAKLRALERYAKDGQEFVTKDGIKIRSIPELTLVIKNMSDDTYYHHVNSNKNDFMRWVMDILNNDDAAVQIGKATNKYDMYVRLVGLFKN